MAERLGGRGPTAERWEGRCPLFRKERIEGSRVELGKEASITQHGDGAGNLSAKPLLITLPPSTTAAVESL